MCIKFMERYGGQFITVLDIGCGSGVLSIAAALLGAEFVLGVDIDEEAVSAATSNVESNGLSGKVRISRGDLVKGIDLKADMVVANLTADLLCLLAEDVGKNVEQGGLFISSGILIEKQSEVKSAIKEAGFEILDIAEDGEWCAILARNGKGLV
jgi:ribosomal protein L11 methyltransferase